MQKDLATLHINRNKVGHDMPGYELVCNQMESSLKAARLLAALWRTLRMITEIMSVDLP
jgi:hypothetical protein